MHHGNLFDGVPDALTEERFETLAEGRGARVERIVSTGQATPENEWYDQSRAEWVCLLRGEATLVFEGDDSERRLRPGDWLHIPAHVRHRVAWTTKREPSVWLAVHFDALDSDPADEA